MIVALAQQELLRHSGLITPDLSDLDSLPEELKALDQWVLWRAEPVPGEKPRKIPYSVHGGRAKSNDPATWATFTQAVDAYEVNERWSGIGYVFTDTDPYVGIDLDACIMDGELLPEAAEIVARFNSYTELSPSGTGVKLWTKAIKPKGTCSQRAAETFAHIEVYDRLRYFAVTGARLPDSPADITDGQDALDRLLHQYGFALGWLKDRYGVNADAAPVQQSRPSRFIVDSHSTLLERARQYARKAV